MARGALHARYSRASPLAEHRMRANTLRILTKWLACGHIQPMKTVTIREAKNPLTELAREVEGGETIVVTRNGRPVLEVVCPTRSEVA